MNPIIITGANGFLGEAVWKRLAQAGRNILPTDRRSTEHILALDVTDPAQLDQLFSSYAGDATIIHLSAAGSGQDGLVAGAAENPVAAVRTNVEGFVQVIEAAARHNIPRVIWASSTTVYGLAADYNDQEIQESAPFGPTTLYGSTKVACEHLGPILSAKHGIDVVSLRLPMVYGPGRWYGGSQEALVAVAEAARSSKPLDTTCWTTQTDWIHVEDAATAIQTLVEAMNVNSSYHIVGHRGSLAEMAHEIAEALNVDVDGIRNTDSGGPDIPLTDDSRIRTQHGWRPRYPTATAGAATYHATKQDRRERS